MSIPKADPVIVPAITLADLKEVVDDLAAEWRDAEDRPYSDRQIERALVLWLENHFLALTENLARAVKQGLALAPLELPASSEIDWAQEAFYARVDYEYDRWRDR